MDAGADQSIGVLGYPLLRDGVGLVGVVVDDDETGPAASWHADERIRPPSPPGADLVGVLRGIVEAALSERALRLA